MKRHRETAKNTEKVLRQVENSRNSDFLLIYEYFKMFKPNLLKVDLGTLLLRAEEYDIVPFESITRARRRVVSDNPELAGNDLVEEGRRDNEQEMKQWAVE